jgi:ABC-type multidrug transport system fused ATPase/permease subunit
VDKIFVLYDGKIIEEGNHEELMRANGLYAKLYSLQMGEKLELI